MKKKKLSFTGKSQWLSLYRVIFFLPVESGYTAVNDIKRFRCFFFFQYFLLVTFLLPLVMAYRQATTVYFRWTFVYRHVSILEIWHVWISNAIKRSGIYGNFTIHRIYVLYQITLWPVGEFSLLVTIVLQSP